MIANSRCIACNLSKKEEKIRKHSDEKKKKEFIQKVTGILYKYGDIESTPMLDKRIQDIYNEYYEEETDYVALKHKYNQYMLEREDEIKEHLKEAKNIKDYQEETLSLSDVADQVGLSSSHFSTTFKQETGKSFVEFLTSVRMDKAKEMLCFTDMKASQISYEVGYKDPHYFSYLFKKTQGCTPSEYRSRRM